MATPPTTNEAFMREVDDELRRDQALGVWKRWGRWIVVAIIAALALFAGYLWWSANREAKAGVDGEQLSAVLDDLAAGKGDTIKPKLDELALSRSQGVSTAARITRADIALEKGDLKTAAAEFGKIAADTKLDKPYRDLALVRQTAIEFDTLTPDAVIARLKPLAVPGNAWFGSAGEMVGVAYMKKGQRDLAGATFTAIAKDETVPETVRSRIVQLAGILGVDALPANGKGNN